ncbi:chromosome partitioning protein ParB, partial [Arthrospira platensis FACHB-971]|nr:chromosome partitioning protein ParB [Arthrospira platensis FACHB-971]
MKTLPNYQIRKFGDRRQIPIKQIVISKVQPRKYFSEQSINKLAA